MGLFSATHILLSLAGCTILYSVGLVIYRLYFHTLRKFPGPKIAAATRWYEFYFDLVKGYGGQFAWEIERMHEVYGPIIRINPDELHVSDPEWIDVLYTGNPTHRDKWPPFAAMTGVPVASFGTIPHHLHRKRKLATSPFFSKRAVQSAEPLIITQANLLCESILSSYTKNEPISLHTRFLGFTTDSVSQYAFEKSLGMQGDDERTADWAETLKMVGAVFPLLRQFPNLIGIALKVPVAVFKLFVPVLERFLRLHIQMKIQAKQFLENEKKNPSKPREKDGVRMVKPESVFHALWQSSLPTEEKSVERLSQEGLVMIVAGSESTSRSLMLAVYYVLSDQNGAEAKLREELESVWLNASDPVPSVKVLEALPWLHACIKETFRTSAVFTTRFPLTTPETLTYKDWLIPPGTPVSMTTRSVMHNPTIFPEPEKFKPERWLIDDGKGGLTARKDLDKYYVPFSRGTRICPGMDLAYAEIHLALASVFRKFSFDLYDTSYERDIEIVRDCFLAEPRPGSKGVRVKVTGVFD